MFKLIVLILLFLLSLLTVFTAPTNWLWYAAILITEFCWIFFILVIMLLVFLKGGKYSVGAIIVGILSLVLFSVPVVGAYRAANQVQTLFNRGSAGTDNDAGTSPFCLSKMITGIGAIQAPYQTLMYDTANKLTLDFYSAWHSEKNAPCVVIVHGGSWAGGDSQQLPELSSLLAKSGYAVASLNYRLAPQYHYPAPVEDVKKALYYLRSSGEIRFIDTNQFVLLGRSAGGQIVLSAAYALHDPAIKGVIDFYGPADMVWGYANQTSPLVLDSRKVMEDYLGGTYNQVPQQYVNSSATETAAGVPTLMMYGEDDPLVSHLHGVRLGKKLDSLRVKHYDVYLPWATHAFDYTLNGPGGQISTWSVLQFLKTVTK